MRLGLALGAALSVAVLTDALLHLRVLREELGGLRWLALAVPAAAALFAGAALAAHLRAPARREGDALALRLGVELAVAGWIGFLLLAQPYREFALELAAVCGVALWSLCAVALARGRLRIPRPLARWEPRAFRLALALVAAEILLSASAGLLPAQALLGPASPARAVIEASRPPSGSTNFGFPHDARGHYDTAPSPPPRPGRLVASIGDSFSAGVVHHWFHYTTVCERELARLAGPDERPVEVYNLGLPALDPPEYLELLVAEALPLEPDLVVVQLFAGNDLTSARLRRPGIPQRWFDRQNVLLWQAAARIERLLGERRAAPARTGRAPAPWRRRAPREFATPEEIVAAFPYLGDPRLEQPRFSDQAYARIGGLRARAACRPGEDFALLFPWIERSIAAAGPTPIVFTLIPAEFQVEDAVWADALAWLGEHPGHGDPQRLARDLPQEVLVGWFAERGIPLLDLLPVLRAVEPSIDGRRSLYHQNDTHFNARGNLVAGQALARFLREHLPEGEPADGLGSARAAAGFETGPGRR